MVQLVLKTAQLRHRLLAAVVLQRDAGAVRERLEQPQIVMRVAALEPETVGQHDGPDRALIARQHRHHGVADAALLEVGAQEVVLEGARPPNPPGPPRRQASQALRRCRNGPPAWSPAPGPD